jgi:UDP-2,3-diacylglucosamine pyrophosphatase LpxH
MTIGITSDIHLGDDGCKLVREDDVAPAYAAFRECVRSAASGAPLSYLILNGDILDFAVASFDKAFVRAKVFFRALARDRLAEEIIYIPGNHDKHIWDAVEWEVNVIRRLKSPEDKNPRPFARTQPGVIDLTKRPVLTLHDVSYVEGAARYGTLFLEGLFERGNVLPINVVYPNLYIKAPEDTILVSHGHMLENAWVLLSRFLRHEPELGGVAGIKELEEHNVPVTSLLCTAVGQAGSVSQIFAQISTEAKRGCVTRLEHLLDRVIPELEEMIALPWPLEFLDDIALKLIRRMILRAARNTTDARYDPVFFQHESVWKRLKEFYAATCLQAQALRLPAPRRIIFGHTHEPIPAAAPLDTRTRPHGGELALELYNTGGWLGEAGKSAEVFFIDRAGTLSSVNIG